MTVGRLCERVGIGLALALSLVLAGCGSGASSEPPAYEGTALEAKPAPDFRLTDQTGRPLALADLRGRAVALAFLDPNCTDVCPLTALHFQRVQDALDEAAGRVVYVAVNVNAAFNAVAQVAEATAKWPARELNAWHFLTGPAQALRAVWEAYGVAVQDDGRKSGEVVHTSGVYLIDPQGRLRWYVSTPLQAGSWEGFELHALLTRHIRALLQEAPASG